MKPCSLCQNPFPAERLDRFSGLDLCTRCSAQDPTPRLREHGIPAEWNVRLGWFNAGLGLPGADPNFMLTCAPELAHHKVMKLLWSEVQVGDPVFDRAIYVRTSDPGRAAEILSSDAIQGSLLALLSAVRVNELISNHVTLKGPTLTVAVRPLGSLEPERVRELELEVAALALNLTR